MISGSPDESLTTSWPPPPPVMITAPTMSADGRSMSRSDRVRRLLMAAVIVAAGVVVLGKRAGGSPGVTSPGGDVLAADLVASARSTKGVDSASGGYVPGVGLVVTISAKDVPRATVTDWVAALSTPLAARLAALPTDDTDDVVVLVETTGADPFGRSLRAPLRQATLATSYRVAVAGGGSALETASTTATTAKAPAAGGTATAAAAGGAGTAGATPQVAGTPAPAIASTVATTATTAASTATTAASTATTAASTATTAAGAAAAAGAGAVITDDFTADSGKWKALAGTWRQANGSYNQTDASGFDYITQWAVTVPSDFAYQATLKASTSAGAVTGGLILHQPTQGSRKLATVVDITDAGTYIRWGHYDDTGAYVFDGGAKLATAIPAGGSTVVKIEERAGKATVFLDGKQVGTFAPSTKGGGVGLLTSQAALNFDDVSIAPL
jgi:hypothetical protein